MASRVRPFQFSNLLNAILLTIFLLSTFVLPVSASDGTAGLPTLNQFIENVNNGDANLLRGVYVKDVMALPVVQQPADTPAFVSLVNGQVTQFNMAAQAGNVGLLAHNYLSGSFFTSLKVGDVVTLVYGDGRTERFAVSAVLKYQALDPNNVHSNFRDLGTQATMSASQVFDKVYGGERHITFQTCIEGEGNLSWGRLFVIAQPLVSSN